MKSRDDTCLLESPARIHPERTGLPADSEQAVTERESGERPLSLAWISDALLARTVAVWSNRYGRPISEEEAVEILMNVKRLAEVLLRARREVDER